ncbi:hypothetical protein GOP47_0016073 [Adiantum capillus-veneris]|uniref:Nodulin-like domain-containing protein n=1 Tax=Adiantum capillus-veneris TaxID=13818 RepID=A0A9D4ZD73_ADICA|nr:hypothetical protein GOP47_0016073 [Adiantum capillus-veneris]
MVKMKLPHANLIKQLINGRWMMAVASFYILACSGATYIFGIYSGAIKKELHYNQETLDTLSFFKDIGANVGIIAGLMNDMLPPWIVLIVGAFMNLFGYLMIWLAVTHRIARPPTWQMNLFICAGANSQTFANTGVMVTFVKNFPQGRGEVLGIIKGFVGLSGALFTQAYHAIYGDDSRGVIFLIALLPSLVTFIFIFFIRIITPVYDKREKRTFYSFLYLALLIAAFLSLAIIVENVVEIPLWCYKAFGAMSVMLVVSNMAIGVRAELAYMKQRPRLESSTVNGKKEQELSIANELPNVGIKATLSGKTPSSCQLDVNEDSSRKPKFVTKLKLFLEDWPQRGDDFTIPQALLSMDLWILFLSLTCGVGAALTAVDNMGQIGESLGYSPRSISTFVSLISIWNFLGRVGSGFGSEILLRRYRCPHTLILTMVLAMACIGYILIAFPTTNTLYIASIILGFCFGAQLSLYFAIMSELFGLKYYATLQSVGGIASPLGSYLLNVRVAGHLYDRAAQRQFVQAPGHMHGELKCMGHECFRLTFLIMTTVSGFGSLVSCVLAVRTRNFYSQDIYRRFHVKPDNGERPCESGH